MVKTCFKCGVEKPLDDFYKHPRMNDGRLNKCKECTKAYVKQHRQDNIDRIRKYDRQRGRLEHRKERSRQYNKRPENKARKNELSALWRERNKEKRAAHVLTGNAIRDKRLIPQPCEVCQTKERVEAHHDDYMKPLEVRWLCRAHHAELHRKYKND